jgi:hypothetical protein
MAELVERGMMMNNNVDRAMWQNRETHRQQEENNAHLNVHHPSQKSIL